MFVLLSHIFLQADLSEYQRTKQKYANEFIFGMFVFYFVILIILIVFYIIPLWKIFRKAGKSGWFSVIPVYNIIILLQITGRPLWWVIWFFIPLVNIIFYFVLCFDIAKSFGKSTNFGIGLALLSIIFLPILGYGKSQYIDHSSAPLKKQPIQ